MLPDALDAVQALRQFFQTGGWVLYMIALISALMFALLLERFSYRLWVYPQQRRDVLQQITARSLVVRRSGLCDLELALSSQFSLIKTLIAMCPLVGLLGTVTGMIQVFDSLALYGTGNPRLMAAGVASATFPTMTGIAVAAAGLVFYSRLYRWSQNQRQSLQLYLSEGET
jgi:biopolymer transport protein ExbB